MRCQQCGGDLTEAARFCPSCGVLLAPPASTVVRTRDVSGVGIAIGPQAHAQVHQGVDGAELAKLFASVYEQIDTRADDPEVDKDELASTVARVEREVAKGEAVNPSKLRRWLTVLRDVAPDILEVTAAALLNPVAGVATAARAIARELRDRKEPTGGSGERQG